MSNHFMKKRKKKKKKRDSEAKRMNPSTLLVGHNNNKKINILILQKALYHSATKYFIRSGKKVFLTTRLVNKGNKSYDKKKN